MLPVYGLSGAEVVLALNCCPLATWQWANMTLCSTRPALSSAQPPARFILHSTLTDKERYKERIKRREKLKKEREIKNLKLRSEDEEA